MWPVATILDSPDLGYPEGRYLMQMQMLGEGDCGRLWTLFSDNFRLLGDRGMIGGELKVR